MARPSGVQSFRRHLDLADEGRGQHSGRMLLQTGARVRGDIAEFFVLEGKFSALDLLVAARKRGSRWVKWHQSRCCVSGHLPSCGQGAATWAPDAISCSRTAMILP